MNGILGHTIETFPIRFSQPTHISGAGIPAPGNRSTTFCLSNNCARGVMHRPSPPQGSHHIHALPTR